MLLLSRPCCLRFTDKHRILRSGQRKMSERKLFDRTTGSSTPFIFSVTSIARLHLSAACLASSIFFCLRIWCFLYATSMMMRTMPPMIPTPTTMNTPAMFFRPRVFGVFSSCSHCCMLSCRIQWLSRPSMKPTDNTRTEILS